MAATTEIETVDTETAEELEAVEITEAIKDHLTACGMGDPTTDTDATINETATDSGGE